MLIWAIITGFFLITDLTASPSVNNSSIKVANDKQVESVTINCPEYVTFSPTQSPTGWTKVNFRAFIDTAAYYLSDKKVRCMYKLGDSSQILFRKTGENSCPYKSASSPVSATSASSSVSGMRIAAGGQTMKYDTVRLTDGSLDCYFKIDDGHGLKGLVSTSTFSSCSIIENGAVCKP